MSIYTIWHGSRSQYITDYHSNMETWRERGPTQVGWTIADQPWTNRGCHRHFLKKWNWHVRLWTLLFWLFFAIGYHYREYWTQFPGKPDKQTQIQIWKTRCHIILFICILLLQYDCWFSYNKYVSQSRTNRRSIAMQALTSTLKLTSPFIILCSTCTCDRLLSDIY